MSRYTIYRHPQRPDVALAQDNWLSGLRAERLLRAGYRDAGAVDATTAAQALREAGNQRNTRTLPARPATSTATAARTEKRTGTPQDRGAPPAAAMFRVGVRFAWVGIGLIVMIHLFNLNRAPQAVPYGEFSEWLNYAQIDRYMERVNAQPAWVVEVEGRWHRGEPECRVRVDAAPRDVRYRWFWWCGRPREEFAGIDRQARSEGFDRVSLHSFADGDGRIRHSGVWHRVEADDDAPAEDLSTPDNPGT